MTRLFFRLTFVDQFLAHLNRRLAHLGNSTSSLESFVNKVISRNNLADKTQVQSLSSVQVDVASQNHFHGLGLTNSLDKTLGTTCTGDNTQLDLRLTENGLFTSIDNLMTGTLVLILLDPCVILLTSHIMASSQPPPS